MKKTRLFFAFEWHLPGHAKKVKEWAKDYDALMVELDPSSLDKIKMKLKEGKKPEEIAKEIGLLMEEHGKIHIEMIKEALESGKEVYGIDLPIEACDTLNVSPIDDATGIKIREETMVKEILKNLQNLNGKSILIQLGATHTWVYHRIKKALKNRKDIEVKREFTNSGLIDSRMKEVYHPGNTRIRYLRFKEFDWGEHKRELLLNKFLEKWYEDVKREMYQVLPETLTSEEKNEIALRKTSKLFWLVWKEYVKDKDKFWKDVEKRVKDPNDTKALFSAISEKFQEYIKIWEARARKKLKS